MRFHVLFGLAIGLVPTLVPTTALVAGDSQKFPYDAVIEAPSAYIRSGGGEQYYPTKRLKRGATVKVYRHDSGGWYMIAPPAGSFSWIAAQFVRQTGQNQGEVVEDNIVAYVGTEFGDDHSVWQRRLSPGETFEIVGEKTMMNDRGPERMLKIRSPRREWRWIAGQNVVAANARVQAPAKINVGPYDNQSSQFQPRQSQPLRTQDFTQKTNPSPAVDQPNWNDPNLKVATTPRRRSTKPARSGREILAQIKDDRRQLDTLDANFRTIALNDKSRWNFTQIEAGYVALQNETSSPALRNQIKMRFAALQRYQKAKAIYDDITQLTSETDRRDAELLSMQSGGVSSAHMTTQSAAGQSMGQATQISGVMESGYLDAGPQLPPNRNPATAARTITPNAKGLIGAGIVETSVVPGTPKFVLLNPTGKILAYLESSSVDLTKHVGQPMGLQGKRHYRDDLQTDYIKVEALNPIQLRR